MRRNIAERNQDAAFQATVQDPWFAIFLAASSGECEVYPREEPRTGQLKSPSGCTGWPLDTRATGAVRLAGEVPGLSRMQLDLASRGHLQAVPPALAGVNSCQGQASEHRSPTSWTPKQRRRTVVSATNPVPIRQVPRQTEPSTRMREPMARKTGARKEAAGFMASGAVGGAAGWAAIHFGGMTAVGMVGAGSGIGFSAGPVGAAFGALAGLGLYGVGMVARNLVQENSQRPDDGSDSNESGARPKPG